MRASFLILFFFSLLSVFLFPASGRCAVTEQLNIGAVSISRANTMVADPKGAASLYWNPAALVNLPEGHMKETALGYVHMNIYLETHSDPNFEGFMNTFGPQAENPGDRDPLDGAKGTNTKNGILQLPIIDKALPFLIAPSTGATYRKPDSRWAFANKMFVPYGGGFENRDPALPGFWGAAEKAYVLNLRYLNPGFGYRVSDTLSLGMTATAGMTIFGVKRRVRSPSHMTALTKVLGRATKDFNIPVWSQENVGGPFYGGGIHPYEEAVSAEMYFKDYFSPAYQLGLLWQPARYFTLGATYMSEFKNQLYGEYKFTYSDAYRRLVDWYGSTPYLTTQAAILNLPYESVPYQSGKAHMIDYVFPQRVQIGIMVNPLKKLRLYCDMHWAEWSALDYLEIQFDQQIQVLQSGKMSGHVYGPYKIKNETGYKDTIHWSYAMEYDLSKKMTFRCGYEHRKASVEIDMFAPTSTPDLDKYGVGFELRLKKGLKIDFAYGYTSGDIYIPNDTSENANSLEFTKSSTSPFAGMDMYSKWTLKQVNFNVTQALPTKIDKEKRKTDKLKKFKENLKYSIKNFKKSLKKLNPFK